MSSAVLVAFFFFAALDWYAVYSGWRECEYIAKPAALALLLLYAACSPQASWPLLAALAFSLLGDVYLMLPADLFIAGLSAFLLGHIAYLFAIDAGTAARLGWLLVIAVALSPLTYKILTHAPAKMRAPVGLYVLVIATMLASACAWGNPIAIAGALLFCGSDAMIAWNRFIRPFPLARLAIIATYHLGQLGLVCALA